MTYPDFLIDWKAKNDWKFRLLIRLSGTEMYHDFDGTITAQEAAVMLPDDCQLAFSELKTVFDKLPIGMPDTPNITVKIDLQALSATAALQTLRERLLAPITTGATIDLGGTTPDTEPIELGNVFVIYTDGGSGGTPSTLVGVYVQRRLPKRRLVVNNAASAHARVECELTLVHIIRAAYEAVTPRAVALKLANNTTPIGPHNEVVDVAYYENSLLHLAVNLGTGIATDDDSDGTDTAYTWWYTLGLFTDTVHALAQYVGRRILRDATWTVQPVGSTPFDHLGFRQQNYRADADMKRDGSGVPIDLDIWSVYFPAFILSTASSGAVAFKTLSLGGLLTEGDGPSLYQFKNMWDFLRDVCAATFCRGALVCNASSVFIGFLKLFQSHYTVPTLDQDDECIRGTTVTIDQPGEVITGCRIAIPGMDGDDVAEQTVYARNDRGTEAEAPRALKVLFHNVPRVGVTDETELIGTDVGTDPLSAGMIVTGVSYIGFATRGISPWKLCYRAAITAPNGGALTGTVMIRVHSEVDVDVAASGVWVADADRYPWPYLNQNGDEGSVSEFAGRFMAEMRVALLYTQRWSCLPYTIGWCYDYLFGHAHNAAYDAIKVPLGVANIQSASDGWQIGTAANANTLLPSGEGYFGYVPTLAFATDTSVDLVEATITRKSLAPAPV